MDYVDINECEKELELLGNKEYSLYKILNFCSTLGGASLLREWISKPLKNIAEINSRLDMVEYFNKETALRMNLFAKLKKIPNLGNLFEKFAVQDQSKKGAKLHHCVKLYKYSQVYSEILNLLSSHPFFYQEFSEHQENCTKVIDLVSKSIDLTSKTLTSEYRINPSFDTGLVQIHENILKNTSDLEDLKQRSSNELGLSKSLTLTETQAQGLLFEGSKKEIHNSLRDNPTLVFSIVSHRQTSVTITCSALKKISKEKLQLNEDYLNAQVSIQHKVIEITSTFLPYVKETLVLLSNLDVILSLAHASSLTQGTYCRPVFNNSGIIDMRACRHPYLERASGCVANTVTMKKHQRSLMLITGPNMGGKSTYLKQVALCLIMAHIGCLIPADSANLTVVDSVMARIGAGDNQLSGVSTFMAEMQELAVILRKVTSDSFLIIDELGRGTSTSEGLGIAWALTKHLSELGCFSIFATHFSELTSMGLQNVANYYTDINIEEESIEMKYRIIPGSIGFSFGIEIAKMAKMPEEIIEDAYRIKKEREELEGHLSGLDTNSILKLYGNLV